MWIWFQKQGGHEKSPKEKPYLTQDQKDQQKLWCEDEKAGKAYWGDNFYACFLDEKWFYTTSRRQKIKILPPRPGEDADKVDPHIPTARSRRYPIKVSAHCFYLFICCVILISKRFTTTFIITGSVSWSRGKSN